MRRLPGPTIQDHQRRHSEGKLAERTIRLVQAAESVPIHQAQDPRVRLRGTRSRDHKERSAMRRKVRLDPLRLPVHLLRARRSRLLHAVQKRMRVQRGIRVRRESTAVLAARALFPEGRGFHLLTHHRS